MEHKPEWLKIPYRQNPEREAVEAILENLNLNTVCREADCPNAMECFSRKTATFMILGTSCTRNCRFCNVGFGSPQQLDADEPDRIARAVNELGLRYVVITSVTRDDLPDGGAGHFATVIRAVQNRNPHTAIEALIPDFGGDPTALRIVTDASPAVISHNMETVAALYGDVRPQAEYRRSLQLLKNIKLFNPEVRSKTGIMLGLGETAEQVCELFDDLRKVDCEFLTIGQYLAPSKLHFPVQEYITPQMFDEYGERAREKGFRFVASAPFVRSSYHAGEALGL